MFVVSVYVVSVPWHTVVLPATLAVGVMGLDTVTVIVLLVAVAAL